MDRLSQLRGEAGGSRDSTLDTTSPPSEAFITANESSSSKFYSLSEVDSTFDISSMKEEISSIKDESLSSTARDSEGTITNSEELMSNLSPIGKKNDILDNYKIDTQIEAANILSGGVAIFDENDNSNDGDELVIDDNVEVDDKTNSELKQAESLQFKTDENVKPSQAPVIPSRDTEVLLQIDGKNFDAIDIGNGLYLYRNTNQELAAVQIDDEEAEQPMFKFLKVRENADGNLEVYEEIEIEIPDYMPVKEGKTTAKNTPSHVPIKEINKLINDSACNKVSEKQIIPRPEPTLKVTDEVNENKEASPDSKSEVNLNGKMMKYNESRKSPVIGSFTPMTYHSTPNKEGIPLTKIMVDQQLHPNRHSDLSNVKKTIEVLTDSCKQKPVETPTKSKNIEDNKLSEIINTEKEIVNVLQNEKQERDTESVDIKATADVFAEIAKSELKSKEKSVDSDNAISKVTPEAAKSIPMEQDSVIDSTENITKENKIESNIILDEATANEKIKVREAEIKLVTKVNIQIADGKLGQITQVYNETNEGKEEAMELDETELPTLEIIPGVGEHKIMESKEKDNKQAEKNADKQEELNVDKPILIEDVLEEVTVKNKEVKDEENVTIIKGEKKLDVNIKETTAAQEIISNVNKDEKDIQRSENVEANQSLQTYSSSCSVPSPPKDRKDLPSTEVKSGIEENITISMVTHRDSISAATAEVTNKNIEPKTSREKPKEITTNPGQVAQPITVPDKMKENKQKQALRPPVASNDTQKILVPPVQILGDEQISENKPSTPLEIKQKQNVEPPNMAEIKQLITVLTPKASASAQKLTDQYSKVPEPTLKMLVKPSKVSEASKKQKLSVQTYKVSETTQKVSIQPSKVSESSQKLVVHSVKGSETSQKLAVQPPKASETSKKLTVQPPNVSEIIEKHSIQAPKVYNSKQIQSVHLTGKSEDKQRPGHQSSALLADKQKQIAQPPKVSNITEKQPVQLAKASDDEQNLRSQLPIISEDKQNNRRIESLKMKDISEEGTLKRNINISPLSEQQLPVPPQFTQSKPIVLEKIVVVDQNLPSVQNVITPAYHKIESKAVDMHVNKDSIKVSPPIASKMQVDTRVVASAAQDIAMAAVQKPDMQKNLLEMSIKMTSEKPSTASDAKYPLQNPNEKGKGVINMEISKVPKLESSKVTMSKQDVSSTTSKVSSQSLKYKLEPKDKKEVPRAAEPKPINNNNAAVPFGKWTEANRQEFLNKFKTKTSVTSSSSNQLKNSNDLNRRDVLKKIDSQRQSSNALTKTQEINKLNTKPETAAFSNKPNIITKESVPESNKTQKTELIEVKPKTVVPKNITKVEVISKPQSEHPQKVTGAAVAKNEDRCQRTGVVQNLIDKTIEGMIHRSVLVPKIQEEPKQPTMKEHLPKSAKPQQTYQTIDQATLDAIEMKMNELHGIPFIERPPHELPQVHKPELKSYTKIDKEKLITPSKSKVPNLLPFPNKSQQKVSKESVIEVDSEDEIIEHEPITGDIDLNKKNEISKPPAKEKSASNTMQQIPQETIITEKDFDKFARRNSITYENCLTVNFDVKEPHTVYSTVQTVVEKDPNPKSHSRNDTGRIDPKAKLPLKYQNVRLNEPAKPQLINKFAPANDDGSNRSQSKLQKAYQSALTAKRQMTTEYPITIIEDKPVKVVFMDSVDYVPSQLNVQGQDLSPAKRPIAESDVTVSTCDSLDSDMMDSTDESKLQDEVKTKTKHQRKQVLTPVEEPELELIEPRDLGLEVSPKKKRKTEDDKIDKNMKYPMRKKIYLLGSSAVTEDKVTNPIEILKNPLKDTANVNDNSVAQKSPVSALDSLVKAAELIETQTENINTTSIISTNPECNPNTPVKRGRGRPRKYPLTPEGTVDKSKVISTPSPQKKPRLIDAKTPKRATFTDDSDTDDEIIKENWTMGKINENIVCPICNKLFRTENVVFKHVKHCTGPSPSRSDSDKRSPRRMTTSQDFDTKSRESKSDDMDIDDDKPLITRKETPKKRRSKDSVTKSDDKDDVIVIEDTPIKVNPEMTDKRKNHESRKSRSKIPHKTNDLVCEFCGKTFRQLSYLVSHKLQHKKAEKEKPEPKKVEKDPPITNKSVYSCEVCKKEFRKLHHLVQHRIIHNPSTVPVRSSRKSSEQIENKVDKEPNISKQTSDDPSAGFRCEPCDKSFRKLHHLVEHRETHDGINRQKTTAAQPIKEEKVVEKPATLYQCDICKKTFRKLQHLNEHKEQHLETSSEKSDDKSVKSSLSTKDIIHECSLCYMVFPNEHSLNKHTIICQRKKRQSKQMKPTDENEADDEVNESPPPEEKIESLESPISLLEETKQDEDKQEAINKDELTQEIPVNKELEEIKEKSLETVKITEKEINIQKLEPITTEQLSLATRDLMEIQTVKMETITVTPERTEINKEHKVPKNLESLKREKKTPLKPKIATKRLKTAAVSTSLSEDVKPTMESSDDDEVRYMLNPNFKAEEVTEEKVFMKVRAKKRSSLQIERPNSKDLVKRRTSLQHPPKIPRLKPKPVEALLNVKKENRIPKVEPVPSTDSDDSETTKYSFPSTIPEKPIKPTQVRTPKDSERKILKKSLVDKRKSLSGIAKRKSLGKAVTAKHKVLPLPQVKKRKVDAEHRCDCGQLFSSAALLSRHTTLAHTPPRIRRRRSPPPEEKPVIKPPPRKSSAAEKPKQTPTSRKSSVRSDSSTSTNTKSIKSEAKGRKSVVKDIETPSNRKSKSDKSVSDAKSGGKPRRPTAHRGVPVPEKMRKVMQKN